VNPKELHDFREAFKIKEKETSKSKEGDLPKLDEPKKTADPANSAPEESKDTRTNQKNKAAEQEDRKSGESSDEGTTPRLENPVTLYKLRKRRSSTQLVMEIPSEREEPGPIIPNSQSNKQASDSSKS
jgi:hypothetical protein